MNATISKWGNSQGVRLPKESLESAGIALNDTVVIETRENEIVLKKATPRRRISLEERFKDFDGEKPEAYDWGKPMGKEVW